VALETIRAGRYSGTYNAVDVGVTQAGYTLSVEGKAEVIEQTDAFAQSIIDILYAGGNAFLDFVSIAYKPGSVTPFWPWGAMGVMATAAAPISRLGSDVASAMVLTDTDNTPAATFPATITAPKAILAPGFNGQLLYNSKIRTVPVRLLFLPTLASTTYSWWTET
jgi:hypothetical protein